MNIEDDPKYDISPAVRAELSALRRENEELIASLPWSTNRTRNEASKLLGEVLRHVTDEKLQASHGCVEVTNAIKVVNNMIGDNEALRTRVAELEATRDAYITMAARWNGGKHEDENTALRARVAELERQVKSAKDVLDDIPALMLPHAEKCTSLRCICWQGKRVLWLRALANQNPTT